MGFIHGLGGRFGKDWMMMVVPVQCFLLEVRNDFDQDEYFGRDFDLNLKMTVLTFSRDFSTAVLPTHSNLPTLQPVGFQISRVVLRQKSSETPLKDDRNVMKT